jgi:hypothetical protein
MWMVDDDDDDDDDDDYVACVLRLRGKRKTKMHFFCEKVIFLVLSCSFSLESAALLSTLNLMHSVHVRRCALVAFLLGLGSGARTAWSVLVPL